MKLLGTCLLIASRSRDRDHMISSVPVCDIDACSRCCGCASFPTSIGELQLCTADVSIIGVEVRWGVSAGILLGVRPDNARWDEGGLLNSVGHFNMALLSLCWAVPGSRSYAAWKTQRKRLDRVDRSIQTSPGRELSCSRRAGGCPKGLQTTPRAVSGDGCGAGL
jgi:hypothetical protein